MSEEHITRNFDNCKILSTVFSINAVSVTGERNKREKNRNQDSYVGSFIKNGALLAVADGLGSCKNSDLGSKLAIDCINDWVINDLPKYICPSDEMIAVLNNKIIDKWKDKIAPEDFKDYDTTLLYVIVVNEHLIAGGIGDGMILCSFNGEVIEFSWNKNEFSNRTLSIGSRYAKDLMRGELINIKDIHFPLTIILTTDGIAEDLDPKVKNTLPKYLYDMLRETNTSTLQNDIEDWVINWNTQNHSDDRTFCMLNIYKEE